mgnify:CR=1 FL=1
MQKQIMFHLQGLDTICKDCANYVIASGRLGTVHGCSQFGIDPEGLKTCNRKISKSEIKKSLEGSLPDDILELIFKS